jgi:3alpha(or 20beta)-hydroxysteroid dehydrogenase
MSRDGRLSGKVALVTGAGRGLGAAIARKFAGHGGQVVIADIHKDNGRRVAEELGEAALFHELDVRDEGAWEGAVKAAATRFGGLDILVNNAGTGHVSPIEEEDPTQHRALVDLNLTGVWLGIRAATAAMAARGGGSIINISSIDGLAGMPHLATYVSTKFAVTGMTKSLAMELGDRNIRVNSIHPGIIQTELVKGVTGSGLERLMNAINRQPLKRMGQPEDIANAALFLASDESAYVTGASLVVDGGHLAGPYRDPLPS